MQNLKDAYKRAKESNKKTGAAPSFPPYFTQIDKILGCRDVIGGEVGGANSISDDEFNTNSDPDSDNSKSNVLKQVPKKILVKGDDGKLKKIFSTKVFLGFLTLVFAH